MRGARLRYTLGAIGIVMNGPNLIARTLSTLRHLARQDPMDQVSRVRRLSAQNVQVLLQVSKSDVYQRVRLHAQALSLKTLLAIVPLLAVVFAIFKGFGGLENVRKRVEALIVENLAASPEMREVVHEHLSGFLANVEGGALGPISVVILVFSVLSLLSHIEDSINALFGVAQKRPLARRFVTYWAILTLGPLVLGASLTLTGILQVGAVRDALDALPGASKVLIGSTPLMISWLGFTALYLVVPNTQVRLRSAFLAALFAGTAWNIVKYLYAYYASHAVTVQNIYGSLAAIPLFMLWIWLSWILVLYGAQLTFAYENVSTFWREQGAAANQSSRELALCRVFLEVARDFQFAMRARSVSELSERLDLPRRLVDDLANLLEESRFINRVDLDGAAPGLVPAKDVASVTIADLLNASREGRGRTLGPPDDAATRELVRLLNSASENSREILSSADFSTLARAFPPNEDAGTFTDVHPETVDVH